MNPTHRLILGLVLIVSRGASGQANAAEGLNLQGHAVANYLREQGIYGSLEDAIQAARYQIRPGQDVQVFAARNPAQGLNARFSPGGLELRGDSWRLGWRLQSVGYGERQISIGEGHLEADGARIVLRHNARVEEWYVNGAAGLEQGFTLHQQPGVRRVGERLRLTIAMRGNLKARASRHGSLELLRADGTVALSYGHLLVTDAAGRRLPAEMGVADLNVWVDVEDAGAAWPVTVDPTFVQEAYLKASNTGNGDVFGNAVAISGDTVAVGAVGEDSGAADNQSDNSASAAGAVYIFVRTGSAWMQQAYLKASNPGAGDQFGTSVAVSGDTIVVGTPFEGSNATGVDGNQADNSAADSGAAYVFVRNSGTWSQQAYLKASNAQAGDFFGISVGVSGDTVVVGASLEDSSATGIDGNQADDSASFSGAAYTFVRNAGVWVQEAYLKASNTDAGDGFGSSVAIAGETVVVGAGSEGSSATEINGDQNDNSAPGRGAVYVFTRTGTTWDQEAYVKSSTFEPADRADLFGFAVAAHGDTIVVGAPKAGTRGAVFVFARTGSAWSEQGIFEMAGRSIGTSVAVSDDTAVLGGAFSVDGSEGAFVFKRSGEIWSPAAHLIASNPGLADRFGSSVAVSGDTVVVGAINEDSNAIGVNGNQEDNSAFDSGAAYVFRFLPNTSPAITPQSVTRQQGTSGTSQIATVNDAEDLPADLAISIQSANPSNGVTLSALSVNGGGAVLANVAASCWASDASFALRVTDPGTLFAEGVLNVTVTPSTPSASASVETSALKQASSDLINVGLAAGVTGDCSPTLQLAVFSNEDDQIQGSNDSPDAKYVPSATLRLRAERDGNGNGRVYLIVATATDTGGHTGFAVTTVVVPKNDSQAAAAAVSATAAAAASYALAHDGTPPPGYSLVGDGPVVGPKQ